MKKVLLLIAACSALCFTACKPTEEVAKSSEPVVEEKPVCNYTVASAKQKEVSMGPEIVVRPLIADIQMGERFAYNCTIIRDDECGGNEIEDLKQQAMHKCMAERKIDFIISPEYLVKLNGGTATISITGRDAFYTNVRTYEQEMKNAQSLSCDEMEHATQYMNFRKDPYNYKGCSKVVHDTVLVNPYCPCCHQKKENINDPVCKKCANGECSCHNSNNDVVVSKDQVAVDKANSIDIPQMIENYDHFSIEINHSNAGSGIISLPIKKVEKAAPACENGKKAKGKKVKRTTKVEEETEE